jgi:hypothetical protein
MPSVVARTWEYWSQRLQAAGLSPAGAKAAVAEGAAKPAAEKKKRV